MNRRLLFLDLPRDFFKGDDVRGLCASNSRYELPGLVPIGPSPSLDAIPRAVPSPLDFALLMDATDFSRSNAAPLGTLAACLAL